MLDNLTPEQKREYLRRLFSEGKNAADKYLVDAIAPRALFASVKDLEEYQAQTGHRVKAAYIIGKPSCPELADLYQKLYDLR